ncbi:MAG: toll/interleukin-1 receptor domain-containing protein [Deltaproteobacteria bacterium]|nr:toll/interleukin-1 receptor domain-containing protein [Deltaproteobacteria bacterium]
MPRRASALPSEIFLSHASANRSFATRLAAALRSTRLKVWYSASNIVGAQQWHDEIGEALTRCDCFVLVLSPAAVKSQWVKRELLYALNNRRYEKRIVPAVYRECDWPKLSWTLDAIQMVDFTESFDAGWQALLKTDVFRDLPPAQTRMRGNARGKENRRRPVRKFRSGK